MAAQILGFLREAEAGIPVKDLCRKHGFWMGSYYDDGRRECAAHNHVAGQDPFAP